MIKLLISLWADEDVLWPDTAACVKAVVASWEVLVPAGAVADVGVPVNAGLITGAFVSSWRWILSVTPSV